MKTLYKFQEASLQVLELLQKKVLNNSFLKILSSTNKSLLTVSLILKISLIIRTYSYALITTVLLNLQITYLEELVLAGLTKMEENLYWIK